MMVVVSGRLYIQKPRCNVESRSGSVGDGAQGELPVQVAGDLLRRLAIPNQTVKRLMYGYLRDGYRDVGVFAVDPTPFSGR